MRKGLRGLSGVHRIEYGPTGVSDPDQEGHTMPTALVPPAADTSHQAGARSHRVDPRSPQHSAPNGVRRTATGTTAPHRAPGAASTGGCGVGLDTIATREPDRAPALLPSRLVMLAMSQISRDGGGDDSPWKTRLPDCSEAFVAATARQMRRLAYIWADMADGGGDPTEWYPATATMSRDDGLAWVVAETDWRLEQLACAAAQRQNDAARAA